MRFFIFLADFWNRLFVLGYFKYNGRIHSAIILFIVIFTPNDWEIAANNYQSNQEKLNNIYIYT